MLNNPNIDININVDEKIEQIKRLNNNDAYKYLGITTAPDGDSKPSYIELHKICRLFAYSIMKANINEEDDERALRYKFLPIIKYQIGAYSLTKSQYEELKRYMNQVQYPRWVTTNIGQKPFDMAM